MELGGDADRPHQQLLNHAAQEHPGSDAAQDDRRRTQQCLPETDPGNMPLFQPQNIVEAQFPLAALHNEAVGVQQNDCREQSCNE